jgi:hypothetical protein
MRLALSCDQTHYGHKTEVEAQRFAGFITECARRGS